MRKLISVLLVSCALVASAVSCYDDKDVWEGINDLRDRVGKLEEWMRTANGNIDALQTIVSAMEKMVYVSSVTQTENGYEIGSPTARRPR